MCLVVYNGKIFLAKFSRQCVSFPASLYVAESTLRTLLQVSIEDPEEAPEGQPRRGSLTYDSFVRLLGLHGTRGALKSGDGHCPGSESLSFKGFPAAAHLQLMDQASSMFIGDDLDFDGTEDLQSASHAPSDDEAPQVAFNGDGAHGSTATQAGMYYNGRTL